jgi:hypothetical protein
MQSNSTAATPVCLDRIAAPSKMIEVAEHAARAHAQCASQVGHRDARPVAENSGQEVESLDTLHHDAGELVQEYNEI